MKKRSLIILLLIAIVMVGSLINVDAKTIKRYASNNTVENVVDGSGVDDTCSGIFTQDALDIIHELLDYFRFLTPAVLIIMIAADLTSVVMSTEHAPGGRDDSMRKALSKISRRLIAAVLLFFIPTIIKIILNLDGVKQAISLDDSCVNVIN